MERNSFCRNMKQHNINNNNNSSRNLKMTQLQDYKVRSSTSSSWDLQNQYYFCNNYKSGINNNVVGEVGGDMFCGFSWPPRSYTCSFCKREFRSAQALGGHMNVHRRDRARLRHHSPPPPPTDNCNNNNPSSCNNNNTNSPMLNLNLGPNNNHIVNTNPTSSPCTKIFPHFTTSPIFNSPNISSNKIKKWEKEADHFPRTHNIVRPPLSTSDDLRVKVNAKGLLLVPHEKAGESVGMDLEIGLITTQTKDHDEVDLELRLGYL